MSDMPKRIEICEKGPREGLQIEPRQVPTREKLALIDSLAGTGLKDIQIVSFVNPKRVPAWADADDLVKSLVPKPGVRYCPLWLNKQGLERALAYKDKLSFRDAIMLCASDRFSVRNQNCTADELARRQGDLVALFKLHGVDVESALVMAAFGCNFEGDIPIPRLLATIEQGFAVAAEHGFQLRRISLNDTMAWATPRTVKQVVGAVRDRWPDLRVNLHFHNTRGLGIANFYAGLEMGVESYDSSVAGLGGCPFAGHKGAAGNVCTEDLVFLCDELGIETGIDVERLIAAAELAEKVVGHALPGSVMRGGTLRSLRHRLSA